MAPPVLSPQTTAEIVARHPAVRMLVLLGSRATGTAHEASDWDVGFLAEEGLDLGLLAADLMSAVGSDDVDVVDLASASAILRRDAAAHGQVLWEREPDLFVDFSVEATLFWLDIEPVVRQAQADVLRALTG